jgi:hypothetical protein
MATRKRKVQVIVSEAAYQEMQQLQRRLDTSMSAAAGMVIATGLAQLEQTGVVQRVDLSNPLAPGPKRKATNKTEPPKDDGGMGFRPKGEQEEGFDGALVPWVPNRGYMAGL